MSDIISRAREMQAYHATEAERWAGFIAMAEELAAEEDSAFAAPAPPVSLARQAPAEGEEKNVKPSSPPPVVKKNAGNRAKFSAEHDAIIRDMHLAGKNAKEIAAALPIDCTSAGVYWRISNKLNLSRERDATPPTRTIHPALPKLRYDYNMTRDQVAEVEGISKERVRQIEKKALEKLAKAANPEEMRLIMALRQDVKEMG